MAKIDEEDCPKCAPCKPGLPAWMGTFSDLVSQILIFFILLYSFSSTDLVKYKEAVGSLKDAFGVQFREPGPFEGSSPSPLTLESVPVQPNFIENERAKSGGVTASKKGRLGGQEKGAIKSEEKAKKEGYEAVAAQLKQELKKDSLEEDVEVTVGERGVVVRARGRIFFSSGSAKIKTAAIPLLNKISDVQKATGYFLEIEGHTDGRNIATNQYPSNWELSSARAATVLRYFLYLGINANLMRAVGYANSRPLEEETGDLELSRNRRVEFVFSQKDWNEE